MNECSGPGNPCKIRGGFKYQSGDTKLLSRYICVILGQFLEKTQHICGLITVCG